MENVKGILRKALGNEKALIEIEQGLISIKNSKTKDLVLALEGKIMVESTMKGFECEKCNSDVRKKELEALKEDRKNLDSREKFLNHREENVVKQEDSVYEREKKLISREADIKADLKTLME